MLGDDDDDDGGGGGGDDATRKTSFHCKQSMINCNA
jgi:hypothetical protein